jgi:Resolvase, N terminal domain/Recombinase
LLIVSHPMEQGPEGWLFFQMRGALAEYERAKILERTKRGMMGRAKAGYLNAQAPLGYRYIPEPHKGRWEIDPEEAEIVRRIFGLYVEHGLSLKRLAEQLTREQVATHGRTAPAKNRSWCMACGVRTGHIDQRNLYRDHVLREAATDRRKGRPEQKDPLAYRPSGRMDSDPRATHY